MPSSRRITPLDLVGLPLPEDPALSPDGERVAFSLAETDFARGEVRTQIHVAPEEGEDRGSRQVTYGLKDAGAASWSPDGRSLAFVTFRPQPHEDEEEDHREDGGYRYQVFLLPWEGGEARRLTEAPEGIDLYRFAPDGSSVVTLGPEPRPQAVRSWRRRREDRHDDPHVEHKEIPFQEICRHPLDGGRPERLIGGRRGIEDFDLSPDGRLLAYATNHTGRPEDAEKTEIVLRDLETGQERRVTRGRGGAEATPRFTADGRYLLFHGWADPGVSFSRQELFAVPLADAEAAPRPLLEPLDRDLEEFAVLPDGRVAVLLAWGLDSRLAIIEPGSGRVHELPIEGVTLWHLSAAHADGRLAAIVERPDAPPEVARIDPETGRLEVLTGLHEETSGWQRARRRRVCWSSGGFEHEGLLLLPPEPAREPPPALVWVHGGPHWRVQDTLRVYDAEAIAADGYAVFLPQYRGSSGYGSPYALASRGDLGGGDARDILAGIDSIVAERLVDGERLAIAGASYGGYMTNWLLATTARFRAGISIAGIFDLAQDYTTSDLSSWEVHYLGEPPWRAPEIYRERSPLAHVESITAPVLILHGLEDDNTIFTNSKALHRALGALGRESELVYYPREGHGIFEPAHRVDALHRMLDWLARHLRGGRATRAAGLEITAGPVRLLSLGHQTRKEYAGVRPSPGRVFLEVSFVLQAAEDGPEVMRLAPCGSGADVVLRDARGDLFRPIGVPVEVQGQPVLMLGHGEVEAWSSDEGRPAALPVTCVFEIPEEAGEFRLAVRDLPEIVLDVAPEPEEPEGSGASG